MAAGLALWHRRSADRPPLEEPSRVWSHAEKWVGVANELLAKYRGALGGPLRNQLEPFMRSMTCPDCSGTRLNSAHGRSTSAARPWSSWVPCRSTRSRGSSTCWPMEKKRLTRRTKGRDWRRSPQRKVNEKTTPIELNPRLRFLWYLLERGYCPLDPVSRTIAEELLKEIRARLTFLIDVGLHYLALDRAAPTLSGGEAQRIRLASQVGSGLVGVLYILDEPSIGLHPRDNDRLLATLRRLADLGNTVVVVEHDEDTMRAADHLVDFGPGPGVKGGEVIAQGTIDDLARSSQSLTGAYLAGKKAIAIPKAQGSRRPVPHDQGGAA